MRFGIVDKIILGMLFCLSVVQVSAVECTRWLNPENLPTREKMPFPLVGTLIRRREPLPDGTKRPQNIFEKIQFSPKDGEPIVFVGWGKFIGDSMIGTVSKLDALHRLFPKSHIYHASPGGNLIQDQSWLTVLPFSSSPEKIYSVSGPQAFWFTQRGTHKEFIQKSGLKGIVTDETDKPNGVLTLNLFEKGQLKIEDIFLTHRDPQLAGIDYSLYRLDDFLTRLYFGNENGFFIPPEFFLRSGYEAAISKHLNFNFPGREKNKFVILNLNTAGQFKINVMAQHYLANLKLMVDAILKKDSSINILVTPPEMTFGADVVESVRKYVKKKSGIVAFLPEDKKHWQAFVAASDFVITQDSGFMHLALAMKDPKRVFGFGHEAGTSDVLQWAMPGQTCGIFLGRMIPEMWDWIWSR